MTLHPSIPQPCVLIADDDPDIRTILETLLVSSGYTVVLARDGSEALSLLRGGVLPDAAILDISMPGADGNEVCAAIRNLPDQGPFIAILMVTARDHIDDKLKSLNGGADDYITKPFNHRELIARLQATLRVHALAKELKMTRELLLEKERQLALRELAGSAAHALNQPLAAMKLNLHLLSLLPPTDERFVAAHKALGEDVERLAQLITQLRGAPDAERREYHDSSAVLDISGLDPSGLHPSGIGAKRNK